MVQAESERDLWLTTLVVAIATVFMLQATRVFVGYLVFVVDQSQRVTLGISALAVFLAPGLAWILVRYAGAARIFLGSTAILIAARLVLQFWQVPEARILLGAAVIIAWDWLAIVALHRLRFGAALGIVLALGFDVAIRIGRGAIDLAWMPGSGAHLVTIALAGILALAAWRLRQLRSGSTGPFLPLFVLGPALALHQLMTGNLALAQAKTEYDFPAAWLALSIGLILGLLAIVAAAGRTSHLSYFLIAVLSGGMTLGLFWSTVTFRVLWLVVATASILYLLAVVLIARDRAVHVDRVGRTAAAFTAGMLLQVALLFVYYSHTGWAIIVGVAWVILVFGAVVATPLPNLTIAGRWRSVALPVGVLAVGLLAVCAGQFDAWSEPQASVSSNAEITVMTYNIQSGFSVDNRWSLEETAGAIEAQNPDVVVLNEVGRGWLVTSGNDELPWLSNRLNMPYVWGPASDDGLWGNAILSRLPMSREALRKFDSTENLKRSAVAAWITVGDGGVWVFGTHLDNPADAGEARMEQVQELIDFGDNRRPAIVAGDLNAEPSDDVLTALEDQGFEDAGARLGADAFTSEDHRRLDYVLTTDGVEVIDVRIPDTWASDHKPVVARIRVGE